MHSADLEFTLHRRDAGSYTIDLRLMDPTSEADRRLSGSAVVHFEDTSLRLAGQDHAAYGKLLANAIFAEDAVRSFFGEALAAAQANGTALSLRLAVGPSAPELHNLRWETLHLPDGNAPLLTGENLRFSRYLSSLDWRPVRLRPQADLCALLAVASPYDAAKRQLAEVRTQDELAVAHAGLGDIPITELATRGQVTLNNLAAHLRNGCDILYLVAHGILVDGEPQILLEQEDGTGQWVPGQELVTRIYELQERPRLVVLVSCQSAGAGSDLTTQDDGALAGLGPRLAEAGVPAVIAMQGNLTMKTAAVFMSTFFCELRRDGQVDRAMAVARGAVRDRPDWWMPVLYMRLRSGRIGYTPGLGAEKMKKWPSLVDNIKAGQCTPIIGPDASEWLLGSRREIAARWAAKFGYPMDPSGNESLPQVAQYLAIEQDTMFMRRELGKQMHDEVMRRYGAWLEPTISEKQVNTLSLEELLVAVGGLNQAQAGMEIFRTLARLPLPVFITTQSSNLLSDALREVEVEVGGTWVKKEPVVQVCRWNEEFAESPEDQIESGYEPSVARPLVFHLFGRQDMPGSLVITEDDYFGFLTGVTRHKVLIPSAVRRALADSALLFLGFSIDDWDFRVLLGSVLDQQGRKRRDRYAHVAAQIDPEAGRIQEPAGARRFLEKYFDNAHITIFWGSVADFTNELAKRI